MPVCDIATVARYIRFRPRADFHRIMIYNIAKGKPMSSMGFLMEAKLFGAGDNFIKLLITYTLRT